MWPGLVQKAKEGGVNTIESYVFWNGHELSPGKVSFKLLWSIVDFRYPVIRFVFVDLY